MKKMILAGILLFSASIKASPVLDQVYLYLPDFAMQERIPCQSDFITYVSGVRSAIDSTLKQMEFSESVSVGIIVAVRQGRQSKVWFHIKEGVVDQKKKEQISEAVKIISVPDVRGIVPFSFAYRLGGSETKFSELPVAEEWFKGSQEGEVTSLIEKSWK